MVTDSQSRVCEVALMSMHNILQPHSDVLFLYFNGRDHFLLALVRFRSDIFEILTPIYPDSHYSEHAHRVDEGYVYTTIAMTRVSLT